MKQANQKAVTIWRVIPFLLIIALAVSLAACKSKKPITADVFQEKLEVRGYSIVDISDQYSESEHMLRVLSMEKDSLHIDFAEIDKNDNAVALFNGNKEKVEAYKGNGSSESSVSSGDYQRYTLTAGEARYTVVRVGATLLYAYCDKSEKDALDSIIKELGY